MARLTPDDASDEVQSEDDPRAASPSIAQLNLPIPVDKLEIGGQPDYVTSRPTFELADPMISNQMSEADDY
jgi:hypothetical protein